MPIITNSLPQWPFAYKEEPEQEKDLIFVALPANVHCCSDIMKKDKYTYENL